VIGFKLIEAFFSFIDISL